METLAKASRPVTSDAASFASGVLGAKPTAYQYDILRHLVTHKRVAVRGPHGLGKTALASWAVLWALTTFGDDAKIITTASSWRQLSKFLWPEIRKWATRGRWLDGREPILLLQSATCGGAEAFPVASNNAAYLEGAHAAKLLYILDEAKAIPESVFDAVEGAFSTGECYALAISTPGARAGRFYDIHRRASGFEDWWTRHVTIDEAIASGRVNAAWVDARRRQWGENSPTFQSKVLGNFPDQEDDALLALSLIEASILRGEGEDFSIPTGEHIIGQDVARFGSDDSAQVERVGSTVIRMQVWHGNDTMETAGKARRAALACNGRLHVDEGGVGGGVIDRLNEVNREARTAAERVHIHAINVGDGASDSGRFANLRAEIFWKLRERFYDGDIVFSPSIPRELLHRLTGELTALKYKTNSRGQIILESKEEMRKAGLPSPDLADALALAFAPSPAADILAHYQRMAASLKEKKP